MLNKYLIALVISVWFLLAQGKSYAFWSTEPGSLKELAAGVATELKEKSGGVEKLYLDKADVKDSISGETSLFPLSSYFTPSYFRLPSPRHSTGDDSFVSVVANVTGRDLGRMAPDS